MTCCPSQNPSRSNGKAKRNSASRRPHPYQDFERMIPVIQEHARVSFLGKGPEEQEELAAECVANAFRAYARLVDLGRKHLIYPSVLARYAVMQVREGRRVGGKLNTFDVLSRYAQHRKRIVVERLDKFDPDADEWQEAVIEDHETPVPEQVAFRVDFPAWLEGHPACKRRIAKALALGFTTSEAARRFQMSASRISQLRRQFESSWAVLPGRRRARRGSVGRGLNKNGRRGEKKVLVSRQYRSGDFPRSILFP